VGSLPFPVGLRQLTDVTHMVAVELVYWGLVAVVFLHVSRVERRPSSSIGLVPTDARGILAAFGVAVAMLAGLWVIFARVLPALSLAEDARMDRLLATPLWWRVVSSVRAGVSEEVLFRGYPIVRLGELGAPRAVALGLPLVVFTVAHVGPWDVGHLLIAGFGGAMLTWLYAWRRNLWVNMLAHCLVDLVAVVA
jgi:membrane protease YdiL (CAAX protease family)